MNAFFLYLLYASVCMMMFYLFYFIVLRRLTFFACNRFYLISTLALSAIIPMLTIRIAVKNETPIHHLVSSWTLELSEGAQFQSASPGGDGISWSSILIAVYLTGLAFMLVQFVVSLYRISKVYHSREYELVGDIRIVKGTRHYHYCTTV